MTTSSKSHPSYSHEAVRIAANLWDERDYETGRLRDLEAHEDAFLAAVHIARNIRDERACEAALAAALASYRAFDPDAEECGVADREAA